MKSRRTTAISLIERHFKLLVFSKKTARAQTQRVHYPCHAPASPDDRHEAAAIPALAGGALCHLLINHLKGDKIHRVWHVCAVFHSSVEIQQAVMGIQTTKQELHAKLLCARYV